MADRWTTVTSATNNMDGETRIGPAPGGGNTLLYLVASRQHNDAQDGYTDKPAILAMDAVGASGAITTYYLWFDRTGDLRTANAIPTDEDGSGTIVGTQS